MESDRRPRRGIIFILSAPSGAGKTTISRAALKAIEGLEASVSLTTRAARENEADEWAAEALIPRDLWASEGLKSRPSYSRVIAFSQRVGVLVGQ